jgi:1-acyl-sn-glycerol-3-phosphate acyltransferase
MPRARAGAIEAGVKDHRSEALKQMVWFLASRAMRRKFYNVLAWNSESLVTASRESPVIVFSNHASWWDAFVDHMIERVFELNHFSLVDDRTLETQGWLKKIGALPIDLTSARGAVGGLRAAREFLEEPPVDGRHPTLLIFPQGQIVASWRRPFAFQGGLAWISKNVPKARLIPLARRFEFLKEDRPHIFLNFGAPMERTSQDLDDDALTRRFEAALEGVMRDLEAKIETGDITQARVILQGGWSLNKKWEWFKRRLRGNTGGFTPRN